MTEKNKPTYSKPKGLYYSDNKKAKFTSKKRPKPTNYKSRRLKKFSNTYFKLMLLPLLMIVAVLVYTFVLKDVNYFLIKYININGTKTFVAKEDVDVVVRNKVLNSNIFSIHTKDIQQIVKENFMGVKNVIVQKKYPNTINIDITERTPIAVIHDIDNYYLVDEEGFILGVIDPKDSNLPQIIYDGKLNVGEYIDEKLVPIYLNLVQSLDQNSINATSISLSQNYIVFYDKDFIKFIISTKKDIFTQVNIIKNLLNQLSKEQNVAKRIDLRYDKVIVEY